MTTDSRNVLRHVSLCIITYCGLTICGENTSWNNALIVVLQSTKLNIAFMIWGPCIHNKEFVGRIGVYLMGVVRLKAA